MLLVLLGTNVYPPSDSPQNFVTTFIFSVYISESFILKFPILRLNYPYISLESYSIPGGRDGFNFYDISLF